MDGEPSRLERARRENMDIHTIGPDMYEVVGEDGTSYEIDLRTMECDCPDFQAREIPACKHLYKGVLIIDEFELDDIKNHSPE